MNRRHEVAAELGRHPLKGVGDAPRRVHDRPEERVQQEIESLALRQHGKIADQIRSRELEDALVKRPIPANGDSRLIGVAPDAVHAVKGDRANAPDELHCAQ